MKSERFLVRGLVQGVGFRYFVYRRARALGLGGWVRNLPGGEVEVLATGDPVVLDELALLLKEGPSHAFVKSVDRFPAEEAIPFPDFRIEV